MDGGFTDGFTSMSFKYMGEETAATEVSILPPADGCTGTLVEADCALPVATQDDKIEVEVTAVVPAAADLEFAPGVGAPSKVIFKQCFSPQSASGRKWRKINDPFKVWIIPEADSDMSMYRNFSFVHGQFKCSI